jgi:hypothetical protein
METFSYASFFCLDDIRESNNKRHSGLAHVQITSTENPDANTSVQFYTARNFAGRSYAGQEKQQHSKMLQRLLPRFQLRRLIKKGKKSLFVQDVKASTL